MHKQLIAAVGIAAATFFAGAAQAVVIASNTTIISQNAQDFSKTYSLDGTKYTGVTVSITAKGDYGTNYNICDDEYFNFSIDGTQLTHWSSTSVPSGVSVSENVKDKDYTLTGTLSLSDAQWAKISADNVMTVSWQNGADVDAYWSWFSGWIGSVSYSVQGSLMPSTTPIATTPVTSNPVTASPVVTSPAVTSPVTAPATATATGSTSGSGASIGATANAVPEPASIALLGLGLAAIGLVRRRRKN